MKQTEEKEMVGFDEIAHAMGMDDGGAFWKKRNQEHFEDFIRNIKVNLNEQGLYRELTEREKDEATELNNDFLSDS